MIIHQPEKITQEDQTILWAKIELEKEVERFPEYLWYRFPNRHAKYLSAHCDAFLVPGLLAGMYFREDIQVRGTVSPRLAYHLDEHQFILNFMFPKDFFPVAIQYDHLEAYGRQPTAVGSTSSPELETSRPDPAVALVPMARRCSWRPSC